MTDIDHAKSQTRIITDIHADLFNGDQEASEEFEQAVADALALLDQTTTSTPEAHR